MNCPIHNLCPAAGLRGCHFLERDKTSSRRIHRHVPMKIEHHFFMEESDDKWMINFSNFEHERD